MAPRQLALVLGSIALAGCPSASTDACPDVPATSTPAPTTLTYLFASIDVEPTDHADVPHTGFNIDGIFSTRRDMTACRFDDYFSDLDPDQDCVTTSDRCLEPEPRCGAVRNGCSPAVTSGCRGGVDNRLPLLLNTLVQINGEDARSSLAAAMSMGRFGIVMQVLDVDDLANDPSVRVRLFRAWAAPGTSCSGIPLDAVYQIDRASLRPGGTTLDDAAFQATGAIINGRLRLAAPSDAVFSMAWPTRGPNDTVPFPLEAHQVTLRFDVQSAGGQRGNFGAWIPPETITAWAMARNVTMAELSVVQALAGATVDLEVNGVCNGSAMSPPVYGHISIGFGFTLVRASIDPTNTVVDAPMTGSCSAVSTMDAGGG